MKILAGTPITLFHMLAQLSARLEETENHLSEAISKEVSERLAAFILKSATLAKSDTFLLTLTKRFSFLIEYYKRNFKSSFICIPKKKGI